MYGQELYGVCKIGINTFMLRSYGTCKFRINTFMLRSHGVCKFRINTIVAFSSMANLVFSFLMTINMSFSKTNKCQQQKKFSLFCIFWTNST